MAADLRKQLEGVRDRLLVELKDPDSSSAVASLAKQLVDVLVKLDALPAKGQVNPVDDLAAKRAARRAANASKRAAKG